MSALSVEPPFPAFADASGQPLHDGYIWIGTVNLNPITNPIIAYWDSALTITAVQPIRTSGGYPVYQGTPANIYVSSDYSIQVQNKNGSVVYSAPTATELISSNLITFIQSGTSAVERTVESKLRDTVSVKDFGAVGNGVTDDSAAFVNATTYMASVAVSGEQMPVLYIPSGTYLITQVDAFSSGFSGAAQDKGIHFYGDGSASTIIKCAITDTSSSNYLGSFLDCREVSFTGMTFNMTISTGRGFNWLGTANGGSGFTFANNEVYGSYSTFFDITGSVLGSETFWQNNFITVPASANFFRSLVNPQALDHMFSSNYLLLNGTFFKMQAGGNIKFYGGYVSMGDGSRFFSEDNTLPSTLGISNRDILIDGVRFETFGTTPTLSIVFCSAQYDIEFRKCAFSAVSFNPASTVFTLGENPQNGSPRLVFTNCIAPTLPTAFTGGVSAIYRDCVDMKLDWTTWLTLIQSSASNALAPNVEIVSCQGTANDTGVYPAYPTDCSPGKFVNNYSAKQQAGLQVLGTTSKLWIARAANSGGVPGLIAGGSDTYTSFSITMPYGTAIRSVQLVYNGFNEFNADKTYKVTDYLGSTVLLPEVTFAGNVAGTSSSASIFYIVDSVAKQEIKIFGKTPTVTSSTFDYGYVVIEYI